MNNHEKQHVHERTTLNQNDLLKLGFTRKMISAQLPAPQLIHNLYFKNSTPMKVWNTSDIETAMEMDDFQEFGGRPSYKNGIPLSEANRFLYCKLTSK